MRSGVWIHKNRGSQIVRHPPERIKLFFWRSAKIRKEYQKTIKIRKEMKVQFDIKYRPQIESGEAEVVTRDGRAVRIICWDAPSDDYPIVGYVQGGDSSVPHTFTREGIYLLEEEGNDDIFVLLPLPDNIFKQAVDTYGADNQIGMLHEEIGELLAAINQYGRGRVKKDAVVTEIADVMIMCEQMAEIFGREDVEAEKKRKIQRLAEKLEEASPKN